MNKFKMLILTGICATGFSLALSAQPAVPMDPAIRTGKLENGLTYYIRHNEEPKERASFYIIQNVGATLENDDQNGLAHFLEHMAFNGTQHFPDKGIIKTLERHGVAFGRNINAYTSFDETVYNLSDIPVKKEGLVDTCLLVLHDWSDYLLLTDKEIDLERGVISEEWRTRRNASFRLRGQWMPVLFKDSKYAVRDVIGDLDVIKNFKYETLRKFYKDWYRTDLQAIAVVGDINVDEVEAKIKSTFSHIKAEVNPPVRPKIEVPVQTGTRFVVATDPEASSYGINIYIKHPGTSPENKNMAWYRDQLGNQLFNRIMGDRIAELLQKGQPPFVSGNIYYGGLVRGYDGMVIAASAHPDRMEEALRAIYAEAQRVYRHGITNGELERAKSNLLTQTETRWKQKDKIDNDSYAAAISDHFLTNNSLESMDFEMEAVKMLLPTISAEELSAKAKKWIVPEDRAIIVTGPQGEKVKLLDEATTYAILTEVEKSEIAPYAEDLVVAPLIDKELTGSKIITTTPLPEMKAVEWTLANNAKVVYRFADFQKDNVMLQGISKGGSSLYAPDHLAAAGLLSQFMENFGVGNFDAIALKKMLAGKNVRLSNGISSLNETFSGSSSPKDFETMLQLLYLKFENPRFDNDAYNALKDRYVAMLTSMAKNPQKVMSDSLQMILSDHSPRTRLSTPELFNEVSTEKMEKIYRERFADAGDFTFFIVGNIDEATVKPLVEKYIGSLTDLPREENWKDNNEGMPKGKTNREILIPLETEKANVVIVYNDKTPYDPASNLTLTVLREVLRLRYTEEIREKEGGTYGVSVSTQSQKFPKNEKSIQINFDTDPAKADYLKSIVYREIDKIVQNGPTAEDFDKVVKNLLKDREQSKPNNSYWMNVLTGFYQNQVNGDLASNFEDILNRMTIDDVKKFAAGFFDKPDVAEIVFKPLK